MLHGKTDPAAHAGAAVHNEANAIVAASPADSSGATCVLPTAGGLPREIVQTGSIEASEVADLHSRVSGVLTAVSVDIGDVVEPGQPLAEIDVPELQKDVERHEALLEQARQRVKQAEARLRTIASSRDAAEGEVRRADSEVERTVAERTFREKEFARIARLVENQSIESKIADEKRHRLDSAHAGERYARASLAIAKAELVGLDARIEQAHADIAAAEADLRVATSELERSRVLAGYTTIRAPFRGRVVQRHFDRGDFVHSAAKGSGEPLFVIARSDEVRVVVRIPDGDVGRVCAGCEASVVVESLDGLVLTGTVSRVSRQQDRRTRTMRAEIDLPNVDERLTDGMYGRVTILVPPPTDRLTLPRECLLCDPRGGLADVHVLCDGCQEVRTIRVGRATDEQIEVVEGLAPGESVVSTTGRDS